MTITKHSVPPSIFKEQPTLGKLNQLAKNTLAEQLNIQFTEIGNDFITATMPVNYRTQQPLGFLHGGASVALAETLGSVAATLCVNQSTQYCVGMEINANHIKSVEKGIVTGITHPIHIGRRTHIWSIKITNIQNKLVAISRITIAVLNKH